MYENSCTKKYAGSEIEMGIGRRVPPEDERQPAAGSTEASLLFVPEEPKYTLDDIILPVAVREKILDVADYAQNSKIVFEDWGLRRTHRYSKRMGINLYGPSGTGKTMAAHAIANYLQRKILVVNYADIESKYVGETPKNIRKAFEAAEKNKQHHFF